jgi:hypothetical protein
MQTLDAFEERTHVKQLRVVTIVTLLAVMSAATVRADELPLNHDRIRLALRKQAPPLRLPAPRTEIPAVAASRRSRQSAQTGRPSDSVWEGLLIGAAVGGVGGYVWARQICGGTDDTECFVISAPVGILGGVGIGALVGAVADRLHK